MIHYHNNIFKGSNISAQVKPAAFGNLLVMFFSRSVLTPRIENWNILRRNAAAPTAIVLNVQTARRKLGLNT